MTCPFCGAAEYKAVPGEFACGSGIEPFAPFEAKQSDICRELCQLREKKAEGLTWEWVDNDGLIGGGSWFATGLPGHFEVSRTRKLRQSDAFRCYRCGYTKWNDFATEAEAKAHAEELHQQAWRELRNKWDFKGGGE